MFPPDPITSDGNIHLLDDVRLILPPFASLTLTCRTEGDWVPTTGTVEFGGPLVYRDGGFTTDMTTTTPDAQIDDYALEVFAHTVAICCVDQVTEDPKDVLLTGVEPGLGVTYGPSGIDEHQPFSLEFTLINEDFRGALGGGTLTLGHEHGDSLAENRFRFLSDVDYQIPPGGRVILRYDNSDGEQRWHVVAAEPSIASDPVIQSANITGATTTVALNGGTSVLKLKVTSGSPVITSLTGTHNGELTVMSDKDSTGDFRLTFDHVDVVVSAAAMGKIYIYGGEWYLMSS